MLGAGDLGCELVVLGPEGFGWIFVPGDVVGGVVVGVALRGGADCERAAAAPRTGILAW